MYYLLLYLFQVSQKINCVGLLLISFCWPHSDSWRNCESLFQMLYNCQKTLSRCTHPSEFSLWHCYMINGITIRSTLGSRKDINCRLQHFVCIVIYYQHYSKGYERDKPKFLKIEPKIFAIFQPLAQFDIKKQATQKKFYRYFRQRYNE